MMRYYAHPEHTNFSDEDLCWILERHFRKRLYFFKKCEIGYSFFVRDDIATHEETIIAKDLEGKFLKVTLRFANQPQPFQSIMATSVSDLGKTQYQCVHLSGDKGIQGDKGVEWSFVLKNVGKTPVKVIWAKILYAPFENCEMSPLKFQGKEIQQNSISTAFDNEKCVVLRPNQSLGFSVRGRIPDNFPKEKKFLQCEVVIDIFESNTRKFVCYESGKIVLTTAIPLPKSPEIVPVYGYVWDEAKRESVPCGNLSTRAKELLHMGQNDTYNIRRTKESKNDYAVPKKFIQSINENKTPDEFQVWNDNGNLKRVVERLHNMLYMEEAYEKLHLSRFDVGDVLVELDVSSETMYAHLDGEQVFLWVPVPHLQETRPSPQRGDRVYIWEVNTQSHEYEGFIIDVEKERIRIVINNSFAQRYDKDIEITRFNLRFTHMRFQWKDMHLSVDRANTALLYPGYNQRVTPFRDLMKGEATPTTSIWDVDALPAHFPFNIPHRFNEMQRHVIARILNKRFMDRPLCVLGPFGCGKTITLAEAVIQVVKAHQNERILIACLTNSAATLLTELLVSYLSPTELGRVVPAGLAIFDDRLRPYSCSDQTPQEIENMKSKNVLITTASSCTRLYVNGVRDFDYLIVDEAGQIIEAQLFAPLSCVHDRAYIVLAGDHHQLGTGIKCEQANLHGLGRSVLERLIEGNMHYQLNPSGNAQESIIQLRENYRCHPDIISFCNRFYEQTITPSASVKERDNGKFPMVFHHVVGVPEMSDREPSFYNSEEICIIVRKVIELVKNYNIDPKNIAVLSETHAQFVEIRNMLKHHGRTGPAKGLGNVYVGRIFGAQGREFDAVFVSLVRSSAEDKLTAESYNASIKDKFINTVLSRSKYLAYVVGDKAIGEHSTAWKEYIRLCSTKECYVDASSQNKFGFPSTCTFGQASPNAYKPEVGLPELPRQPVIGIPVETPMSPLSLTGSAEFPTLPTTRRPQRNEVRIAPPLDFKPEGAPIRPYFIRPEPVHPVVVNDYSAQFPALNVIRRERKPITLASPSVDHKPPCRQLESPELMSQAVMPPLGEKNFPPEKAKKSTVSVAHPDSFSILYSHTVCRHVENIHPALPNAIYAHRREDRILPAICHSLKERSCKVIFTGNDRVTITGWKTALEDRTQRTLLIEYEVRVGAAKRQESLFFVIPQAYKRQTDISLKRAHGQQHSSRLTIGLCLKQCAEHN